MYLSSHETWHQLHMFICYFMHILCIHVHCHLCCKPVSVLVRVIAGTLVLLCYIESHTVVESGCFCVIQTILLTDVSVLLSAADANSRPELEQPVNNNQAFVSVVRTRLNTHSLGTRNSFCCSNLLLHFIPYFIRCIFLQIFNRLKTLIQIDDPKRSVFKCKYEALLQL